MKPRKASKKQTKAKPTAAKTPKPAALKLNADALKLVDGLCEAWGKAVEDQFRIGETIDKLHKGYSRLRSYKVLAGVCKQRSGVSFSRKTLQAYHTTYSFRQSIKATQLANIKGLSHTHWVKAATCCPDLALPTKVKLLEKAAAESLSVAKLRNEIILASGEAKREARAKQPVKLSGALESGKVYNCLAKDLIGKLADKSVTLVVLDWQWTVEPTWATAKNLPTTYPYNVEKDGSKCVAMSLAELIEAIELITPKILPVHGLIAIHCPCTFEGLGFDEIRQCLAKNGFVYDSIAIWDKERAPISIQTKGFGSSVEFVWIFRVADSDKEAMKNKECLICSKHKTTTPCHPFQKPVEFCEVVVEQLCPENHIVVDCFAGSGSYGVAAKRLNRRYYGAEKIEYYANLANGRIKSEGETKPPPPEGRKQSTGKLVKANEAKRNKRAKQTCEIFTPHSLVNDMLNKLPATTWEEGKTHLDPACGNGNMLVAVLKRKLEKGHNPLEALKTIYGVDLMADNVKECRLRLLKVISQHQKIMTEHIQAVLTNVLKKNGLEYDFSFSDKPNKEAVARWQKWIEDGMLEQVDIPFAK